MLDISHLISRKSTTLENSSKRTPANPNIDAEPITALEVPRTVATGGRPKKLKPMPAMEGMSETEQVLFNDFIDEYLSEYPDITPTDYRMLFLVAVEYIKYLRIVSKELSSGKVLSMARQHPGTNMRALQDQLSITRKARTNGKQQSGGEEAEQLRAVLYQLGNRN